MLEGERRGVVIVVCDGLKGLPDAITATWPKSTVQTCVIHLTGASLRLSSARDYPKLLPALKAIYAAPTEPKRHAHSRSGVSAVSRFLGRVQESDHVGPRAVAGVVARPGSCRR
ncbi:transposase [Streptomyces sp. NPDC127066]|uniref:transposase n=1 Tax=Streptomyces sp. NPDC127066 TaxID=3347125 RepID=UPI003664A22A